MKLSLGIASSVGRDDPEGTGGEPATIRLVAGELRLDVLHLADGQSSEWPLGACEEALYVVEGSVEVGGRRVAAGGATIAESAARATVTARGPATIARFCPGKEAARGVGPAPGRLHIVGPAGWCSRRGEASVLTWFADSTCDGCDVSLLRVERDVPHHVGRPHSHSVPEVILVLAGEVRLGAHRLGRGDAVLIPADVRYRVRGGPQGYAFVNYRAARSWQTFHDGPSEPEDEAASARGASLVSSMQIRESVSIEERAQ